MADPPKTYLDVFGHEFGPLLTLESLLGVRERCVYLRSLNRSTKDIAMVILKTLTIVRPTAEKLSQSHRLFGKNIQRLNLIFQVNTDSNWFQHFLQSMLVLENSFSHLQHLDISLIPLGKNQVIPCLSVQNALIIIQALLRPGIEMLKINENRYNRLANVLSVYSKCDIFVPSTIKCLIIQTSKQHLILTKFQSLSELKIVSTHQTILGLALALPGHSLRYLNVSGDFTIEDDAFDGHDLIVFCMSNVGIYQLLAHMWNLRSCVFFEFAASEKDYIGPDFVMSVQDLFENGLNPKYMIVDLKENIGMTQQFMECIPNLSNIEHLHIRLQLSDLDYISAVFQSTSLKSCTVLIEHNFNTSSTDLEHLQTVELKNDWDLLNIQGVIHNLSDWEILQNTLKSMRKVSNIEFRLNFQITIMNICYTYNYKNPAFQTYLEDNFPTMNLT